MTKESVVNVVNGLPNEFVLDDLIEKLIFIEKVEAGVKEIEDGKGVPLEQLRTIVRGWRK